MTLNTFHNAGISSKNVTLGVPRLLELLNVSRHQKHASMNVSLYPPWDKKRTAQQAQHLIEYCTLESVTKRIQFIYDPDPRETVVEADRAILELEWSVMDESDERARLQEVENGSPWIARLELDADMFVDKALNMKDVKQAILRVDDGYVIETGMANDTKERTIRMRPKKNDGVDSIPRLKHAIPELLARVHLRGIPGVRKALLKDRTTFTVDPATGKMKGEKTWLIDTDGTALRRAFIGIVDEKGNNIINATRTSSNKVPEVCSLLALRRHATRCCMSCVRLTLPTVLTSTTVITPYWWTRYVSGLSDGLSRVGINRSEMSGPLMRCSFEETVKVLMAAAAFGERILCVVYLQTLCLVIRLVLHGSLDLVLNMAALQHAVPQEDAWRPARK
ncbi:hypothetical protein TcBrA4_0041610 [Trypanosoma cruzi]|nr:hypothetical protein TcBrA4_0041610 [Trypanosoma cruzi]